MYDIILKHAKIIDGTGNPGYHADVAVKDGKIARIGRHLEGAAQVIDCRGRVVTPGFIDVHSHQDLALEDNPLCTHSLEQGITTLVGGMCGESPAPLSMEQLEAGLRVTGAPKDRDDSIRARCSMGSYFRFLNRPTGVNTAFLVGHGNLRAAVMGYENRKPTAEEMEAMKELLRQCIKEGAMGLSFGLIYPPGSYADTEELTELCKVVAETDTVFTVHLRSENRGLVEATDEIMRVVRATNARCVISHHKATGGALCWNKTAATVSMMKRAVEDGFDVFCDQYPYTASSTGLNTNIPEEMFALGEEAMLEMLSPARRSELRPAILGNKTPQERFVYTMIGSSHSHPEYNGRMLNEIAASLGVDPYDLQCDLLIEDRLDVSAIFHTMNEEDVERVMQWDRAMVGTDGVCYAGSEGGHPRTFATFPRILGRYVRERKVITLENAIRKMCYLPAMVYGFHTKGLIREGMDADLVVFDPETICDRADFVHPREKNVGLDYVLVAGQIAVRDNVATGVLAGTQLLRKA